MSSPAKLSGRVLLWLLVLGLFAPLAPAAPPGGAFQRMSGRWFDTCAAPSASAMNTWWSSSPYYAVALYIGGINRACAQPNLTASWVSARDNSGWDFAPVFVSYQAPAGCGAPAGTATMSSSTTTAASQGAQAADNAVTGAAGLGFSAGAMIFLDIEAWSSSAASCTAAVRAFVNGWTTRMSFAHGSPPGVYGSACGSRMQEFGTITWPPDTAWIAQWDNVKNVFSVACVPSYSWTATQRHKQYAGEQTETWGGVTLTVDRNCAQGGISGHYAYGLAC